MTTEEARAAAMGCSAWLHASVTCCSHMCSSPWLFQPALIAVQHRPQLHTPRSPIHKQVVAGLRQHISREELTGRLVALVLNLKPAKLAGELSEAMILAADHTPVRGCRPCPSATLTA